MQKNDVIVLELPWPPSVNHYWRHTSNGHYISKEGINYRNEVYYASMKYKGVLPDSARLRVHIEAFPPDKRKRDIDNLLKSTLDALQFAGVYGDDNQIDKLSITRNSPLKGRILVNISPM